LTLPAADYNNLGHPSTTPVSRPLRPGWSDRHEKYCDRAGQGVIDLVFLGDSLTQRWEGAPRVWDKYYGRRNAAQMGIDNDGTQQLLWRIDHGTLDNISPKLLVLLIGVNNLGNDGPDPSAVRDGAAAVIDRIRRKLPETNILLLGLLPYEAASGMGLLIAQTNQLYARLADGQRVRFLDVGRHLLDAAGQITRENQPDLAHLSERGYEILAGAIEPMVKELMGE